MRAVLRTVSKKLNYVGLLGFRVLGLGGLNPKPETRNPKPASLLRSGRLVPHHPKYSGHPATRFCMQAVLRVRRPCRGETALLSRQLLRQLFQILGFRVRVLGLGVTCRATPSRCATLLCWCLGVLVRTLLEQTDSQ